ncbi:MAG: hypothetical protein ACLQPD_11995 [Desulfomonilaceae bacterium]
MFFSKTILKLVAYLASVVLFGLCLTAILERDHLQLITKFETLKEVDPRIRAAELADKGDYCQALEYMEYFMDYDYVGQNPAMAEYYRNLQEKRDSLAFRGQDVWNGVWAGKGSCPESMISSTVTDFLIIGDVRSLVWEAAKWWKNEPNDDFVVALASIGILASALTYGTGGAAAPAKGSLSLLKVAKKADKISAPLQKSFVSVFKEAKRTRSLNQVKPISDAIYQLATTSNMKMRDFLTIVSRADNVRDVRLMPKVAKAYGKKTGKLLSLGGDDALRIFRRFGNHKDISSALDTAVKYGPEGTRLLVKVGPSQFLKYVTLTKYAARTTRSVWQGHLTSLLTWSVKSIPQTGIWILAVLSGIIVVSPVYSITRWVRRLSVARTIPAEEPVYA